jgi:hypothetical protein
MICPTGKVENIFEQGWTGQIRLKGFKKFGFKCGCRESTQSQPAHRYPYRSPHECQRYARTLTDAIDTDVASLIGQRLLLKFAERHKLFIQTPT